MHGDAGQGARSGKGEGGAQGGRVEGAGRSEEADAVKPPRTKPSSRASEHVGYAQKACDIEREVTSLAQSGQEEAALAVLLATPRHGRQAPASLWHHRVLGASKRQRKRQGTSWTALQVYDEMLHRQVPVDSKTHVVAMVACVPKSAERAVAIFTAEYKTLRHNQRAWLALVNALGFTRGAATQARLEACMATLQKPARGVVLDTALHGAFVQAAARSHDIAGALSYLNLMTQKGLAPQPNDLAALLKACSETNNVAHAEALLQSMHGQHIPLQAMAACPHLFNETATVEGVRQFLQRFDDAGVEVPRLAYITLTQHCREKGAAAAALTALRHIKEPLQHSEPYMNVLHLVEEQATVGIEVAVSVMILMGAARSTPTWGLFFKVHAAKGAPGVLRYVLQMEAEGIPPERAMLHAAKRNCETCGEYDDAEAVAEEARRYNIRLLPTLY